MAECKRHYLHPSNFYVSQFPTEVTTVLGSCVAVCLYDPVTKIGGINHFMLPLWSGEGLPSPKYGDVAMQKLIQKVISLGGKKERLIAKVFGGNTRNTSNVFGIGKRNIALALEILKEEKIPVVGQHTGGMNARKLIFKTYSGEVLLKVLQQEKAQV